MSECPYLAPTLTLRVGVTGHRPNKLEKAVPAHLQARAGAVLARLAGVARRLQHDNDALPTAQAAFAREQAPVLRLATAIAAGADSFVAEAAIANGYALSLILPFPRARYAQDFSATERASFERLLAHDPATTTCTELDVGDTAGDPRGYVAAGHLILDHTDVLLAVWDGEPGNGPGGTADIVAEAQRRGMVIVRIALDGALSLWDGPEAADMRCEPGRWQDLVLPEAEADAGGDNPLTARLRQLLAFPQVTNLANGHGAHKGRSALDYLRDFRGEELPDFNRAWGYNLLRYVFGAAQRLRFRNDLAGAEAADSLRWQRVTDCAAEIGGAAYGARLEQRLAERWRRADRLATHFAQRFRSAYVMNYTFAALAVFFGLLILPLTHMVPVDAKLWVKAGLVVIELVLIGAILRNTRHGLEDGWHRRWLDYRSLAEALRPARLPLLMGSSPLRSGSREHSSASEAWMAWYVRSTLREFAPPSGLIDAAALRRVIDVAIDAELDTQMGYHQSTARELRHMDHRMEHTAHWLLRLTIASGLVFLAGMGADCIGNLWHGSGCLGGAAHAAHAAAESSSMHALIDKLKTMATFLGGVLPVFGAALLGIRATGDFRAASRQSEHMLDELERLCGQLQDQSDAPDRVCLARTLGRLSLTLSDDLRVWGFIYSERGLEPGF